jgi:hypothetical protein
MEPSLLLILVVVAVMAAYGGLIVGTIFWMRRRRKTRWPFKDTDKLLRSPGETLKRRIAQLDEEFTVEFFVTCAVLVIILPVGAWLAKTLKFSGYSSFIVLFLPPLFIAVVSAWRIALRWKLRSDYFLGWFGERMTAEHLRPLQLLGYRVFHDVPCVQGDDGFNIDHAVVGPTGVTVVETKTRRKGNARPGLKDHEVNFDGKQLNWPWGYDRDDIQQTINQADWLRKWIEETTGWKVSVKCVLSLPGWFVRESPSPIRVVHPSYIADAVRGRGQQCLTDLQIDQIARQLEIRCRDVQD